MGTISILRGRLALELPPVPRSAQDGDPLPRRQDLVTSRPRRDVHFAAATIERWYYAARHGHDDPVRALRRAVRKDRGKIALAARWPSG